jgi:hypothetical protein
MIIIIKIKIIIFNNPGVFKATGLKQIILILKAIVIKPSLTSVSPPEGTIIDKQAKGLNRADEF